MKRLVLFVGIIVFAAGLAPLSRSDAANGTTPASWPPLLNCADVDGTGNVDIADILKVVLRFGTHVEKDSDGFFVSGEGYMLLYDTNGGGVIDISDILVAVLEFGQQCPLVETQVAKATLATAKYQDWNQAVADGFIQSTQYVTNMGIHVTNNNYTTMFDHTDPIGLIYKQAPGGGPDELIGLWYVVPIPEVCSVFGLPNPESCPTAQPEGFDGPEDNTDVSSVQRGWHTHPSLCVWNVGTTNAQTQENVSQQTCEDTLNGIWFSTYGWMVHLYNFIPNQDGRFMMWAYENLP